MVSPRTYGIRRPLGKKASNSSRDRDLRACFGRATELGRFRNIDTDGRELDGENDGSLNVSVAILGRKNDLLRGGFCCFSILGGDMEPVRVGLCAMLEGAESGEKRSRLPLT